jgi:hypothetical protein
MFTSSGQQSLLFSKVLQSSLSNSKVFAGVLCVGLISLASPEALPPSTSPTTTIICVIRDNRRARLKYTNNHVSHFTFSFFFHFPSLSTNFGISYTRCSRYLIFPAVETHCHFHPPINTNAPQPPRVGDRKNITKPIAKDVSDTTIRVGT